MSSVLGQKELKEMGRAGIGVHPFAVFPEELWLVLAQKLEDSAEILKLIKAIPEIKEALDSRKRCWLFDQVIPFVYRWLKHGELVVCRQVCKQWCHGVDNFLENHPFYRAYDHENQVTGQIWIPEGKPRLVFPKDAIRGLAFDNQEKVSSFLQLMEGHPRNPIVGRAVELFCGDQNIVDMMTGITELLPKVGSHIWFLVVVGLWTIDPPVYCEAVKEWLRLLPNLKSLRLILIMLQPQQDDRAGQVLENEDGAVDQPEIVNGDGADDDHSNNPNEEVVGEEDKGPIEDDEGLEESLEETLESLPQLPYLEALEIPNESPPQALINALVASYSKQIRKLWLIFQHWKPEFSNAFPNLTKLTIGGIATNDGMSELLLSLRAPLLRSLTLGLADNTQALVVETDILPWLKRFPMLQNFCLSCSTMPIRGATVLSPEADSIPSLKYLWIMKQFLHSNSDFLLCFPNLEYLHLDDDANIAQPPEQEPAFEPNLKIWDCILNDRMYESNVWEHLPKLKRLTLTNLNLLNWENPDGVDLDDADVSFKRETYEYLKKSNRL